MKKLTAMMLVLACFLALTGCKPAQPGSTTAPTTAVPQTTAAPPTTVPPTTAPDPATFTEVWVAFGGVIDFAAPIINGVRLRQDVNAAMQAFSNENYIFALSVSILSENKSKEEVYEAIFKPFITYEELKGDMNLFEVFLTAEQINALKCPPGFEALVFMNEVGPDKFITKEGILEITGTTRRVDVWFKCETVGDRDENVAALLKTAEEIFSDYGITDDMLYREYYGFNRNFEVELEVNKIARMLEDPRIDFILDFEHAESKYVLVDRISGRVEYIPG